MQMKEHLFWVIFLNFLLLLAILRQTFAFLLTITEIAEELRKVPLRELWYLACEDIGIRVGKIAFGQD